MNVAFVSDTIDIFGHTVSFDCSALKEVWEKSNFFPVL